VENHGNLSQGTRFQRRDPKLASLEYQCGALPLRQELVCGLTLVNTEMNVRVPVKGQISDCQLLRANTAT
jgi:hypothetical protein